jgi:hypothetical protein
MLARVDWVSDGASYPPKTERGCDEDRCDNDDDPDHDALRFPDG